MELVTIGEAAQMLALNTSALRYYEDRGLVTPERRRTRLPRTRVAWPADHPVDQCPHMIEVLDKRLDGLTIEELAAEQGQPVPSAS
jgi:hypothetical protein